MGLFVRCGSGMKELICFVLEKASGVTTQSLAVRPRRLWEIQVKTLEDSAAKVPEGLKLGISPKKPCQHVNFWSAHSFLKLLPAEAAERQVTES